MPRTKEQFLEMKDERRESILNAALPLFSIGQKVTIDGICEKAKCSHGIVYHYFKNVDQIYEKLLKLPEFLELKQNLLEDSEGSTYEKIEHIVSILLDFNPTDISKISYLNILIKSKDKDSVFSLISKLIKLGQSSGSIVGGDPIKITETFFLIFNGLYLPFLLEKHPDIKVPSLETVMQFIRKPSNFSRQIL